MLKKGIRVRVVAVWDREATDKAVHRHLAIGELGTVLEDEEVDTPSDGGVYVDWDAGGSCFMVSDEIVRVEKTGLTSQENHASNSARSAVSLAHVTAVELLWPHRYHPKIRERIRVHAREARRVY